MNVLPLIYTRATDIALRRPVGKPLFELGRLFVTPGTLDVLATAEY